MKNKKTIVCCILDRSGSMRGKESDVIGGINKLIADQKKLKEPCSLALVRFDDQAIERFREMTPIRDVVELSLNEFQPRGYTPLLDAIGQTIVSIKEDFKKEKAAKAIVVIVTDGLENSSKEYNKQQIKDMIQDCEKNNISFLYLGANVDAFAEASNLGIRGINTAGYVPSSVGTQAMYSNVSYNISHMRGTMMSSACCMGTKIEENWVKK